MSPLPRESSPLHPWPRILLLLLVLGCLSSLIVTGILGVGRSGKVGNFDGAMLYAAGRTWLAHGNPYDHDQLSQSVRGTADLTDIIFFYPPQSAVVCVPLGIFSYSTAKPLWLTVNLLSLAAIIGLTAYGLKRRSADKIGPWIMAAVILGNPFTSHVLWMGQTSLLALASIIASFTLAFREDNTGNQSPGRQLAAGLFFGLASFKPQLCLFLGIWLLLERRWLLLAVAAVTAFLLSGYPMLVQGPLGMLQAWHDSIRNYSALIYNASGATHKVGFDTLLQAAGLHVSSAVITLLGILGVVVFWIWRRRFDPEDTLAILMGLTFLFVGYNHDYDYVGLIPVLSTLWYYVSRQSRYWTAALPLTLLLFAPQRLVRGFGSPVLDQWRTIIVLLLLALVCHLSLRQRNRNQGPAL